MMSEKLSKDKLISWLDTFVFADNNPFNVNKECIEGHIACQAYKQIKQLIEAQAEPSEELIKKKTRELGDLIESWNPRSMDDIREAVLQGFIRNLFREKK